MPEKMSDIKQVIVVNGEIDLSKGKLAAQVAHASLGAYKKADSEIIDDWERSGAKKVVLDAGDRDIVDIFNQAKESKVPVYLVKDAGRTELEPGTKTALGIGPAEKSEIDRITGELELIK